MGREFQLWGPAIENARSPAFMKVRGTTRLDCERRPSRLGLLKSSMSEMYGGKNVGHSFVHVQCRPKNNPLVDWKPMEIHE